MPSAPVICFRSCIWLHFSPETISVGRDLLKCSGIIQVESCYLSWKMSFPSIPPPALPLDWCTISKIIHLFIHSPISALSNLLVSFPKHCPQLIPRITCQCSIFHNNSPSSGFYSSWNSIDFPHFPNTPAAFLKHPLRLPNDYMSIPSRLFPHFLAVLQCFSNIFPVSCRNPPVFYKHSSSILQMVSCTEGGSPFLPSFLIPLAYCQQAPCILSSYSHHFLHYPSFTPEFKKIKYKKAKFCG